MLCVGLTGGISSGKSTVANLFSALGTPIIDTDIIAHKLTEQGSPAYQLIAKHFGPACLLSNKKLNRRWLRDTIFANPKEKEWLEATLHPLIRQNVAQQIAELQADYCIIVIPLLIETSFTNYIDRILVIDATPSEQIIRTIKRDKTSIIAVKKILAAQCSREKRLKVADDIIENVTSLRELTNMVNLLHKKYLKVSEL